MSGSTSEKVLPPIAIFGTSGFAREVADIAIDLDYPKVVLLGRDGVERFDLGYSVVGEDGSIECELKDMYLL